MKVIDGRTGSESWRQGTTGFMKDFDGDPTATNHNKAGLKKRPQHNPHMAKQTHHKPRPTHEAGQSSSDDE